MSGSTTWTPTEVRPDTFVPLETRAIQILLDRLKQPVDLSGYLLSSLGDINAAYDVGRQSLENRLASAGLLRSPMAASAYSTLEDAKARQAAQLMASLPLLGRELQGQDLQSALQWYGARPLGYSAQQQQTTSGNWQQTQTMPGNKLGGLFGGLADVLGFMAGAGKGPFGKK